MRTRFALAAVAAACVSAFAAAQMGPGMGPGTMGGPGGHAMMQGGDCPMHPGMGPGGKGQPMGGHGMGGGPGAGHGMMGGAMGPGTMQGNARALAALDLTPDQRAKVTEAQRDLQRKHHGLMGALRETHWKMQDAAKDGFNEDAARKHFDAMAAVRKEMFEAGLEARKRIDAVLTPEQREKLRKARPTGAS